MVKLYKLYTKLQRNNVLKYEFVRSITEDYDKRCMDSRKDLDLTVGENKWKMIKKNK